MRSVFLGWMLSNLPARKAKETKMAVSDLWRSDGTIGRTSYLMWGTSLFGIKYGIDSFVAEILFHRHWEFWRYLFPGQGIDFLLRNPADQAFYLTIMACAIPFIWFGVILTIGRLRAAGLPVFLVYLFFVPFVNLLLFVILSTMPSVLKVRKPGEEPVPADVPLPPAVAEDAPDAIPPLPKWPKPDRSIPSNAPLIVDKDSQWKRDAVRTLCTTVPPSLVIAWLSIFVLKTYGFGVFIGLPFGLGMMAAYDFGRNSSKSWLECIALASAAVTILGLGMFFFAWEGMVCLVMAAPIVYALAAMGAVLGYYMQRNRVPPLDRKLISIAIMFALPLLMGAEYAAHPEPPMVAVCSNVEIAAPPNVVWNHVIAFPELGPPDDWFFKLGIAYPVGATISGAGPGAVRKCRFSTGAFIEPIKVWNAPSLLQFGVIGQPPSMREWSWYPHEIHPAHLNGYLDVHAGQFELQPINDGKSTLLKGTTWYQNHMWPDTYWRLWSDDIIHRIHMRVLKHIKKNAESQT